MTTLLCMGFSDAAAIRKALRLAKNDINEAVALLTNERPGLHYGGYEPMESGQGPPPGHGSPAGGQGSRDGDGGGGGGSGGFDPPPAYHEVVETEVSCGSAPSPPPHPGLLPPRGSPARPALPRAQRCRDGCEVGAPRVSAGIRGMRGCPGFSFVPCVSLHKERVFSWNCLLRARGSVGWVLLWISRSAFCVRFFSDKPNAFRSRHTVSLNVLQTKAL